MIAEVRTPRLRGLESAVTEALVAVDLIRRKKPVPTRAPEKDGVRVGGRGKGLGDKIAGAARRSRFDERRGAFHNNRGSHSRSEQCPIHASLELGRSLRCSLGNRRVQFPETVQRPIERKRAYAPLAFPQIGQPSRLARKQWR